MNNKNKKEKKNKADVEIEILGGVGEFGRNCCVVNQKQSSIMVDCGIMFPDDNSYGIDGLLPYFGDVKKRAESLDAIIITHAHEDHVGALGWLIKEKQIPIYGTKYSLKHIKQKIKYYVKDVSEELFISVEPGETVDIAGTKVTFVSMTHSIPSAVAIGIETDHGIIFHTGDFKLDHTPISGSLPDFYLMSSMGEFGVALLMSDSTNAHSKGWTESELAVREMLENIVLRHRDSRIIFATFSSHMHRVKQITDVCIENGRKISVLGKSMHHHLSISKELAMSEISENNFLPESKLNEYDQPVGVVCTGSQGEVLAVLSKMAKDQHKDIKPKKGDVVVFSSHTIPGNEKAVSKVINLLVEKGVKVYTKVHVSGHAASEELKHVIALTKPKFFMPVHGENDMIKNHADLAKQMKMDLSNIVMSRSGDVIRLFSKNNESQFSILQGEVFNRYYKDKPINTAVYTAKALLSKEIIEKRKSIAQDGVLFITIYENINRDLQASISHVGWLDENLVQPSINTILENVNEAIRTLDFDTISVEEIMPLLKKNIWKPLQKEFGRAPELAIKINRD